MELELKHLAGYLPYGLKCHCLGLYVEDEEENPIPLEVIVCGLSYHCVEILALNEKKTECFFINDILPLLRPLSSLDTQELINDLHGNLPDNVFDWIDSFNLNSVDKNEAILCAPFPVIQWCYKNHFDIYGLIDAGLAIAIED